VRELVSLGRTPYLDHFGSPKPADRQAVARALLITSLCELAERPFPTLSGGERQRAVVALALAQEPEVLLLDEPTTHLDLQQQVAMLQLLSRLNREQGKTILAVLHDVNQAALYYPRLLLLKCGELVADGTPGQVLEAATLRRVYNLPVAVQPHPDTGVPHVVVRLGEDRPS
jgi:ABC-type cobalamin/Fe3+-siderophores transport system ATPase subunit